MRILFDKSAPYGLGRHLEGRAIATAEGHGWGRLENGDLLRTAEEAGFDVFFTSDRNLRYQQNLSRRKIAIVVLGNSPWHLVRLHIAEIVAAIHAAIPGSYAEIEIPLPAPAMQFVTAQLVSGIVKDEGVRECFSLRETYQLFDSAG